ncbi:MAG: nicotinate-nucleotide--dimethylbenzimidazole phosphoribosyltransferase [Pseudomonadota bacterium]
MTESAETVSPFDDARALALQPVPCDEDAAEKVRQRLSEMGRETDFGRLGEAAQWLARWQRRYPPRVENATLAVFAGSHGLATHGVSLSSDGSTRAHVEALTSGRAPLSAIAAQNEVNVQVMELALDVPTQNIAEEPAMSERDCAATIAYGFEALANKPDVLALGVSGAGIGTAAAAVAYALYGGSADYWVRPGPGTPVEMTEIRAEIVEAAVVRHRGHFSDPLDALACLGGRELAACVGAIIAARLQGVPVMLDGFATTIAAGVVHAINPQALSHVMAAHSTRRPAHEAALERIDLRPLLDLEYQTGGGLGSTTAIGLLKTACAPFIAQQHNSGAT